MTGKSVVLAAVVLAAACDLGPRLAPVSLQMIRADGSGGPAAQFMAHLSGETSVVPTSAVASLTVAVSRVEALPRGGDENSDHGWLSVDVSANGAIDLMSLPTDPAAGITLAAGAVPVGTYAKVRLFFTEAAVTFNTDVTVGNQTFEAGVAHPVTFPSGEQNGIKTQVGFEVLDGGGVVTVAFDAETTFRHVGATGSGRIHVPPVLR